MDHSSNKTIQSKCCYIMFSFVASYGGKNGLNARPSLAEFYQFVVIEWKHHMKE